jgi:hypothetical protein
MGRILFDTPPDSLVMGFWEKVMGFGEDFLLRVFGKKLRVFGKTSFNEHFRLRRSPIIRKIATCRLPVKSAGHFSILIY